MWSFRKWLETGATTTASIAPVPMRMLADRGKPYIGVPGRPSPYDKKKRPTRFGGEPKPEVIRRQFPGGPDDETQNFDYPWLKDQYGRKNQILSKEK